MKKINRLSVVLERHGVSDAYAYLQSRGETARIGKSSDPDVYLRGNVQMMKKRTTSRDSVREGFARLKYL